MDIVEQLDLEVARLVDDCHGEVIERFLRRMEGERRTLPPYGRHMCAKHRALNIYVGAKLQRHRLIRNRDFEWNDYGRDCGLGRDMRLCILTDQIKSLRRAYYGTECTCGNCRSKPNPFART